MDADSDPAARMTHDGGSTVTEPIIFISRNRIIRDRSDDVAAAFGGAVRDIGSTKPRTALFAAYLDERGGMLSVVHAFADAAAMAEHFEGSAERSQASSGLIALAGFEVFGDAPATAIDQLKEEATRRGAVLDLHLRAIGGFMREGS
jgi:hypothetical protein